MAELTDEKRERFAQMLAQGFKKSKAFALAGWKPDRGNACRVSQEPAVMKRVAELKAQLPEVIQPPTVEIELPQSGEKVTRESMTRDIDLRILKAEAAGEWPTVSALTATRAKLHGLLLQEQAVASDANRPLADIAKQALEMVTRILEMSARRTPAEIVQRMLGIPVEHWASWGLPDGGRPLGPKGNGHARTA